MEILKQWLNITVFHNTVRDYAGAALVLLGLVLTLHLLSRIVVRRLEKFTARTETDFDDFLVSLIARIGTPTFIAVSIPLYRHPVA